MSTPLGQKESCQLLMAGEAEPGTGSGGEDKGTARPSVTLGFWKGFSQGNQLQMAYKPGATRMVFGRYPERQNYSHPRADCVCTGDRAGGHGRAHLSPFLHRNRPQNPPSPVGSALRGSQCAMCHPSHQSWLARDHAGGLSGEFDHRNTTVSQWWQKLEVR